MGILIPCVAKHLLRGVLSQTPGNFLAEKTWNTSLKTDASIGALPWFTLEPSVEGWSGGLATLTNEKRNLHNTISQKVDSLGWLALVSSPEATFGPHAQILHDEPGSELIGDVVQLEGA